MTLSNPRPFFVTSVILLAAGFALYVLCDYAEATTSQIGFNYGLAVGLGLGLFSGIVGLVFGIVAVISSSQNRRR